MAITEKKMRLRVVLLLAAALTAWGVAAPTPAGADTSNWIWTQRGSLLQTRLATTATLVDLAGTGQGVLLVGGGNETNLDKSNPYQQYLIPKDTCEFYPVGAKEPLAQPSLKQRRVLHTATLLTAGANEGKLLVVGGLSLSPWFLDMPMYATIGTCELFDPQHPGGGWNDAGSLPADERPGARADRLAHTATLLTAGPKKDEVLVTGGLRVEVPPPKIDLKQLSIEAALSAETLDSCAMYNTAGKWEPTGRLTKSRALHTATELGGGKVLVTGGVQGRAELDVKVDLSKLCTHPDMEECVEKNPLVWPIVCLKYCSLAKWWEVFEIKNLDVQKLKALTSCELYDPVTGQWDNETVPQLTEPRVMHTATLLPAAANKEGKVLVAGGQTGFDNSTIIHRSYEVYDPESGNWTCKYDPEGLPIPSSQHTATLFDDGTVLLVGGSVEANAAQIYYPDDDNWSLASDFLSFPRVFHTATLLPAAANKEGKVLVAGGALRWCEIFGPPSKSTLKHRRVSGPPKTWPPGD